MSSFNSALRRYGVVKACVASADSYIPLADAANLVLLQESEIEAAARRLLGLPA